MASLAELFEEAERRPLLGWDLGYDGRIGYAPPWDIEAIADESIGRSPDLLDMGTGGGEWLSGRPFPKGRTVATEGWPPNVSVAQARLAPLGVSVVAVEGAPDNTDQSRAAALPALPFVDAAFHLVINRHEAFVASEVARVLTPGGRFVTQQVGSDLGAPFRTLIGVPPRPAAPPWTLAQAIDQVRTGGLEITGCGEGAAIMTFADVGALAWYLIRLPWVMPEFSIARARKALAGLYGAGAVTVPQPMFWLAARKPAA